MPKSFTEFGPELSRALTRFCHGHVSQGSEIESARAPSSLERHVWQQICSETIRQSSQSQRLGPRSGNSVSNCHSAHYSCFRQPGNRHDRDNCDPLCAGRSPRPSGSHLPHSDLLHNDRIQGTINVSQLLNSLDLINPQAEDWFYVLTRIIADGR